MAFPGAAAFDLHDLAVTVVGAPDTFVCKHAPGLAFTVEGEDIAWVQPRFSQYALAALAPLLPAKQRPTSPEDWMTSDAEIACPDPHCGARFRIERRGLKTFMREDTTRVPRPNSGA